MVSIKKKLCPASRYYLKCPYSRTATRIVIHNTANDAPAENEISYMLNNDYEVSYHYAVDDREIVQGLPLDRNAWASGDGHGDGNMEGIHIEICYSLSGGSKFTAAEKNAAELTAYLLQRYGWGLDKVTKHQDYDGKYCPHRTLDLGWQRFLNMVKGYLQPEKEEPDLTEAEARKIAREEIGYANPTYHKVDQVPEYWREDIRELVDKGVIRGGLAGDLELRHSDAKAAVLIKRALEQEDPVYRTIDDVPAWGRPYVQELIDRGTLEGEEAPVDGVRILNLRYSAVRLIKMLAENPISKE